MNQEKNPSQRGAVSRFWLFLVVFAVPLLACVVVAARTGEGHTIIAAVQRFLLFYAGVFALIALTAAVGAGLLATDRIVMSAGQRIALQAVHRAISLLALAALITHIVLEIMAHKAQMSDALVPFLAHGRTFYIGLGTIASDLVVLIAATGILRRRFAAGAPWAWRLLHTAAYLAWPFAIVHGLLAGRTAKPYVDWSYGACVAAVVLALVVRSVASSRSRDTASQPVPASSSWPPHPALVPGQRPVAALTQGPAAEPPTQPGLPRIPPPRPGMSRPGAPLAGPMRPARRAPGERR